METITQSVQMIQMTPAEWAAVKDNPRQRDTERHAKKALRRHLKAAAVTQHTVSAARLPWGDLVKLDGHTRSLLWAEGTLKPPAAVQVLVYPAADMSEAKELYTHFDGDGPVENAADRLTGAFREWNMAPRSQLICDGGISTALGALEKGASSYEIVRKWKRELLMLDSLELSHRGMTSAMVAGALALLRVRHKETERILEFVRLISMDGGVRNDQGSDGVDAFCRYVKLNGKSHGGRGAVIDLAGKFISAGEGWLSGHYWTTGIKSTSLTKYLSRAPKVKADSAARATA